MSNLTLLTIILVSELIGLKEQLIIVTLRKIKVPKLQNL